MTEPFASRSQTTATSERDKRIVALAAGAIFGYAASLAGTFIHHYWILDATGHPVVEDFVAFWSAGRQVLAGKAIGAYDAGLQHAAEVATIGHNYSETLGWSYPPPFLFVVAVLATIPYTAAFLAWCAATLALYAGTAAAIARRRLGFVIACAAPWVPLALMPGQNGFLTAGLIGLVLLQLEKRQIVAGILLGLLSYKPQFGLLFPLALAAGGYWRGFASAVASTLAINGAAAGILGFETFGAFLHALSETTASHLTNGGLGWNKLQSLYGFARAMGATGAEAWIAQAFFSAGIAYIVVQCWRGDVPFALKAALLATAVVLTTPYVFVYDLPLLGIAGAFLFRQRNFDDIELGLLAATFPCMFAFLWLPIPSAFLASLSIGVIALRRLHALHAAPVVIGKSAQA
jgi:hypothetical protein